MSTASSVGPSIDVNIHPNARHTDARSKTLNLPPVRPPDRGLDGRSQRGIELGDNGIVGEIGELSRYGRSDVPHEAIGDKYAVALVHVEC